MISVKQGIKINDADECDEVSKMSLKCVHESPEGCDVINVS